MYYTEGKINNLVLKTRDNSSQYIFELGENKYQVENPFVEKLGSNFEQDAINEQTFTIAQKNKATDLIEPIAIKTSQTTYLTLSDYNSYYRNRSNHFKKNLIWYSLVGLGFAILGYLTSLQHWKKMNKLADEIEVFLLSQP